MNRTVCALLLAVFCVPSFAQNVANTQPTAAASVAATTPAAPHQGRKKRVAVFDFDYATVQTASAAAFGSNIDVGKGISDLTVKYLVQDGTYSVIERKAMDKILAEQNFSNSDRANPTSAAKLGKLLGVDAIIVGSVTQFGNDNKNTNLGGGGSPLGHFRGAALGHVGHSEEQGRRGSRFARIINIDTAEIYGRGRGQGRVVAREHLAAGRRGWLAWLGRRRRGLR